MPDGAKTLAVLLLTAALLGIQIQCSSQNHDGGSQGATAGAAISSFTGAPMVITAGGSAQLTGLFTSGTGLISPGDLPATSGKPVIITPAATTVYTLTVTGPDGTSATAKAGITVVPAGAAVVTPNSLEASGAQQATAGGTFANGTLVGEPVPATVATSPSNTFQLRHGFLAPVPAPAP